MNLINIALSQYGIAEHSDSQNPEILKYFQSIGYDWVKEDETAWCSAFVNWVAKVCGHKYSGKLNARSWLDVGTPVEFPILGDVVILWRESPNSWKGHVGFYINETGNNYWILGGNQMNSVRISQYPKNRILGFRRI
jgi:uncharacterized protein (TIGR02594 family)